MSQPNSNNVSLRQATLDDVEAITELLNLTYRSDLGWTNETKLVGGIRITKDQVIKIIDDPKNYLFLYPQTKTKEAYINDMQEKFNRQNDDLEPTASNRLVETGNILATISVQIKATENCAYIGLFSVHPSLQGQGIGNTILNAAETFASRHLLSNSNENHQPRLMMSILQHRPELLAYYKRRGYQLNGDSQPFPKDAKNGEPKRDDLRLLTLEKSIDFSSS